MTTKEKYTTQGVIEHNRIQDRLPELKKTARETIRYCGPGDKVMQEGWFTQWWDFSGYKNLKFVYLNGPSEVVDYVLNAYDKERIELAVPYSCFGFIKDLKDKDETARSEARKMTEDPTYRIITDLSKDFMYKLSEQKKAKKEADQERNNFCIAFKEWLELGMNRERYCFYEFLNEEGLNVKPKWPILWNIGKEMKHIQPFIPFEDRIVFFPRQSCINVDNRDRLHSSTEASFKWADGTAFYHWNGVQVPEHAILKPETITIKEIEAMANAEVRRCLVERYDAIDSRSYIVDAGGIKVASDDWGTIWRKPEKNDTDLYKVQVIDPSTTRQYFLDFNPKHYNGRAAKEPRAAVASTWRRKDKTNSLLFARPEDYNPDVQT